MNYVIPYEKCPVIGRTVSFRLVEESDTEDLLMCYSDKEYLKIFNSDNCLIDFYLYSKMNYINLLNFGYGNTLKAILIKCEF